MQNKNWCSPLPFVCTKAMSCGQVCILWKKTWSFYSMENQENNTKQPHKQKQEKGFPKCTCHHLSHYRSSETARTRLVTHSLSTREKNPPLRFQTCAFGRTSPAVPQHNASLKETSPRTILSTLNAIFFVRTSSHKWSVLKTWQSKASHLSNDPH